MEEVLDLVRRDFKSANRVYDEEFGVYVDMSDEVVEDRFEQFKTLRTVIWADQQSVKHNFVDIAFCLYKLRRDDIYKVVAQSAHGGTGYTNFYTFCQDVFGFKKRTTANLLKVFEEFGNPENGNLSVEYINYSFYQLTELSGMQAYRERIPVTMSTRNIKKLKELYKEYTPSKGKTVEDDLKEWQVRHDEKKAKDNAEKNSIHFVPAQKSDKAVRNLEVQASAPQSEELAESDREDERLLSTPEVTRQVSFEQIRSGLLRQLELLSGVLGWKSASELFKDALVSNCAAKIARSRDVVQLLIEHEKLKQQAYNGGPAASGDKLNLKNEKIRREWLDNFRSWGVWRELPEVHKQFYRYDFVNGNSIIVEVGVGYFDTYDSKGSVKECERVRYSITDDREPKFNSDGLSYTLAVKWLTEHSKEI